MRRLPPKQPWNFVGNVSKSSQRLQGKLRFWLEITRIQTAQPWIAMDQKQTVQRFSIELTPGASELTSVADI